MDKLTSKEDDKPLTDDHRTLEELKQHLRDLTEAPRDDQGRKIYTEEEEYSFLSWSGKLKFHIEKSLNWIFKFVLGLFGFLICLFGFIFLYFLIFG